MDDPEGGFMEYIEEIQEQVILVGVQLDENDNVKESLDELEELGALILPEPRQWENYPEP